MEAVLREKKLVQDLVADRAGISRTTVNGYVTNRLRLGRRNAEKLGRALQVPAEPLITEKRTAAAAFQRDAGDALLDQAVADARAALDAQVEIRAETRKLASRLARLDGRVSRLEARQGAREAG